MNVNMATFANVTSLLLLLYLAFETNVVGFSIGVLISYMCLKIIRNVRAVRVPPHGKAVFITGCDSGFGHMLSVRLDQKGYKVFSGCLVPDGLGAEELKTKCSTNLHVLSVDVTSEASVKDAEDYVRSHLEDNVLWGVVNNAGIYGHGDVELCSLEMYKRVADVNLYGTIRVTKAFLPLVRQSQGRIVNISSINGRYSLPGSSPYNATKYALECVSDTLRMEIAKFGVKVAIIEPGMFGGSTNVHAEANIQRHYSEIEKSWNNFSPEVRQTYTKKYMEDQINTLVKFRFKLDAKSPDPVLDAVEHALSSSHPKYRYPVHGGPLPFDPIVVYGVMYGYLPEWITDWVGCKMTQAASTEILNNEKHSLCQEREKFNNNCIYHGE